MPTNDYSKNIVYLSKEQYQELITNETLTVNGQTITYNDNDIYVTPQTEPITDVKLAGTSIGNNGVANIPLGTESVFGIFKASSSRGIGLHSDGILAITKATNSAIQLGADEYKPIVPLTQHRAIFYGLSKVAGVDLASETVTLGTYPDTSKAAIQNLLGITNLISTEESSTATAAHVLNSTFMMNGKLHRATAAIAIGDAVEVGTNCEVVKADEIFVKKTDIANGSNPGIIKINPEYGIGILNGFLTLNQASVDNIKAGNNSTKAVSAYRQHEAVFYGLSKVAGVDLANETVTLGTYPETSKTAIRSLIGAGEPLDVQINGISIVSSGVANIPLATSSDVGVIKPGQTMQVYASGAIDFRAVGASEVKAGTTYLRALTPERQHASVFYGLAKAAGADMASSDNAIGTYTETAKVAIRSMLGATSSNVIAVQDEQPTDTDTKVWIPETATGGVEVPTVAELEAGYVKKTDIASSTNYGIIKATNYYGVDMITTGTDVGFIRVYKAPSDQIKAGVNNYRPIVPSTQHESAFYGLAKAAGDTTMTTSSNAVGTYTYEAQLAIRNMLGVPGYPGANSIKLGSSNTIIVPTSMQHEAVFYGLSKVAGVDLANETVTLGTYPETSKTAIRAMLGVPGDVQVNGTSVVSNGIANIPKGSSSTLGVVACGVNTYGITIADNGNIRTVEATDANIKAANNNYQPITSAQQHKSVFYGLAKAAGDTTMTSSSNAVGTYTTEAKAAIHTMLGIDPASIAAQVDIPLVETVSGTTPTITGQPNVRYVCGEVSTISITPPASGSMDVIFESGSTATTMTVPSTVKWPAWFDATSLEANTTYEILITDGIYGSVMTWAT